MSKFSEKNRTWIIFILLVIIAFFIMTIDYHGKSYLQWLENIALQAFSPLSRGVSRVTLSIKDYFHYFNNLHQLEEENRELKKEMEAVLQENSVLKERLIAYERLKKLLELTETLSYEMIPALVISREPGNWFNSIIIDKGETDGVQEDMAVATSYGLVGKIISVSSNSSKVMLILDQRSAVGAMIQRSRDIGVIRGSDSNYCYLEYLSYDADIKINDLIITSGLGSIFPKGIKIGRVVVVEKEKHDLFQRVLVKPEVDFTKLEEVLVVKKSD